MGAAGQAARAALPPEGGPASEPTVPALCLSCHERLALCRGLCRLCYERLGRAVREGKTTWVKLEEGGQALPAVPKGSAWSRFNLGPKR